MERTRLEFASSNLHWFRSKTSRVYLFADHKSCGVNLRFMSPDVTSIDNGDVDRSHRESEAKYRLKTKRYSAREEMELRHECSPFLTYT